MVTKKRTVKRTRRAAPRAAPRRRSYKKSGISMIPAAAATVGLVAANVNNFKVDANIIGNRGIATTAKNAIGWKLYSKYISTDQLTKDAIGFVGGYVAGAVVQKYAPSVIKSPLGKIAKKIPKVI